MGSHRLKRKIELNYRRGTTSRSCSQCNEYVSEFEAKNLGGETKGLEHRCRVLGLNHGVAYRVHPQNICDRFDNSSYLARLGVTVALLVVLLFPAIVSAALFCGEDGFELYGTDSCRERVTVVHDFKPDGSFCSEASATDDLMVIFKICGKPDSRRPGKMGRMWGEVNALDRTWPELERTVIIEAITLYRLHYRKRLLWAEPEIDPNKAPERLYGEGK